MSLIDLTYPIHEGMFKYPSDAEPDINIIPAKIEEHEQVIYDESGCSSGAGVIDEKYKSGYVELKIRTHHGTHIDFPAHKIPGGKTSDDYEISKFINSAKLVDLSLIYTDSSIIQEIDLEDIKESVDKSEGFRALVFYTGFCDRMTKNEGKLLGETKKRFEKTFPYFSQEAAEYIAKKCAGLNIVGIDSFAVDPSGSNSEVHRTFFEKDILPLEAIVNLRNLKKALNYPLNISFELNCVPLPYKGADAAQTRAYAVIK